MIETYSEKNWSVIGVLLGAICINVAFIRDEVFYAVVGVCIFILVFVGELDIFLSRRAGRDANKDYIVSNGEEGSK